MDVQTAWPITMAWLAWLVLLGMVETGVWLIRQMLTNRWAHELAVLNMENARRRAERDADENTRIKRDNDG